VFFHIKSIAPSSCRPALDDRVHYALRKDARGRPQATKLQFADRSLARGKGRSSAVLQMALAFAFLTTVAVLVVLGWLHPVVGISYAVMSVVALAAYAIDISAARAGRWRTAESTLHVLGLIGGWPGALVAQQVLRHKSKKVPFLAVFWVTVVANLSGMLWLLSASGQQFLSWLTGLSF
jgi:uncharacterized membrane protein YsdA (DUF1294 family)